MKHLLITTLIATLASGCGWHLRGSQGGALEIDTLYLSTDDSHNELVRELRQMLEARGINLAETPDQAPYQLTLSDIEQERRTAGVGSDALANAFELTWSASYRVTANDQSELANTTTRTSRRYDYSPARAASASREEELLWNEMRRELARRILDHTRRAADGANAGQEEEHGADLP